MRDPNSWLHPVTLFSMGKSKNRKPPKPKKKRPRRPYRSVFDKAYAPTWDDGFSGEVHDPDLGKLLLGRGWIASDGPNSWDWPASAFWLDRPDAREFDGWMPTNIYVNPETRVVEFVCDAKGLVFSGQQTPAFYFPTRESLIDDLDVIEKFRAGDPFPPPLRTAARIEAGEFDALIGDRESRSRPITGAEIDALLKERDAKARAITEPNAQGQ